MSDVDGLGPGWPRLCSRVAAFALLPLVLTALRIGGIWSALFAMATCLAFESNNHRVPMVVRQAAVVLQALGLLAFVVLVFLIAGFAEGGHTGYEYMLFLWPIFGAILFVGGVATVGGARTLAARLNP